MNVNNYGFPLFFSTGYDMSLFTGLTITFTRPDKTTFTRTNPQVSVPSVDVETTAGLFAANKYVSYFLQAGDINQEGEWSARVTYDSALPEHLTSDTAFWTVDP